MIVVDCTPIRYLNYKYYIAASTATFARAHHNTYTPKDSFNTKIIYIKLKIKIWSSRFARVRGYHYVCYCSIRILYRSTQTTDTATLSSVRIFDYVLTIVSNGFWICISGFINIMFGVEY